MNLAKLFITQRVLRDRIGYEGADRLEKLILALLVEVGECANEWRGFKFWSKDQEPRTNIGVVKSRNNITGYTEQEIKNPLLEEYVDGLHFVLEIGLEEYKLHDVKIPIAEWYLESNVIKYQTISKQFNKVYSEICTLEDAVLGNEFFDATDVEEVYINLLRLYIGLGEMLGFTWEQIEQAYYDKNQVNHVRQDTGY